MREPLPMGVGMAFMIVFWAAFGRSNLPQRCFTD